MDKKIAFAIFASIVAATMFVIGHLFSFAACWVLNGLGMNVGVGTSWRVSEMPLGQWYFGSSLGFGLGLSAVLAYVKLLRETIPEPNAWKKPERAQR